MAKANYTPTQLAICKLCDSIREVLAIHPKRIGWIVRPHHTNKQILIGHKESPDDPMLRLEIETLISCLENLGSASKLGYVVCPI